MNSALKDMLDAYQPKNPVDYQNAAREVVQELALLGLWRAGFFSHAAFYGGTALRIFHGLRRFSEDLDFTLLTEGSDIRLDRYLSAIATELTSWGFTFEVETRSSGSRTGIESAFLKGNTQLNLLHIGTPPDLARRLPAGQNRRGCFSSQSLRPNGKKPIFAPHRSAHRNHPPTPSFLLRILHGFASG
jgi:hypothetical protein